MMTNANTDKIIITSCAAIVSGGLTAVLHNVYTGDKSDTDNAKSSNDTTSVTKCKCPFANSTGIGLTVGTIVGSLTWLFYK